MPRLCDLDNCDRPHRARGLCSTHYNRTHTDGSSKKKIYLCAICGSECVKNNTTEHLRRYCSTGCRAAGQSADRQARAKSRSAVPNDHPSRWIGESMAVRHGDCTVCASPFVYPSYREQTYCSPACSRRALGRRKTASREARRKARRRAIFERDGYICQVCARPTSPEYHYTDLLSPTVDHILPRSKGGGDDPSNLRTAHMICNSTRQDKDA